MRLPPEEQEALTAALTKWWSNPEPPIDLNVAIWIAAKNYCFEHAAQLANDFDFGLDSQSGLVKDIRALKDSV